MARPPRSESQRRTLWEAISRTKTPTDVPAGERLADLYGLTDRGRPNTHAAADDLGVSQRTVQRWIQSGHLPQNLTGQQVSRQHQDWQNSAAGREGKMSSRREARLRSKGTTIEYLGMVEISRDRRKRKVSAQLDGDQVSAIIDALKAGDDASAHSALEDAFGDLFGGSVTLSPIDISTYL